MVGPSTLLLFSSPYTLFQQLTNRAYQHRRPREVEEVGEPAAVCCEYLLRAKHSVNAHKRPGFQIKKPRRRVHQFETEWFRSCVMSQFELRVRGALILLASRRAHRKSAHQSHAKTTSSGTLLKISHLNSTISARSWHNRVMSHRTEPEPRVMCDVARVYQHLRQTNPRNTRRFRERTGIPRAPAQTSDHRGKKSVKKPPQAPARSKPSES